MEQIILFNEIKKYLKSFDTDINIVDQIDDRDRRFHFRNEFYLMLSFREVNFNTKDIKEFLGSMYNNYSTSPSQTFTDDCMEIQDVLLPFLKSKERQEKIENILKDG